MLLCHSRRITNKQPNLLTTKTSTSWCPAQQHARAQTILHLLERNVDVIGHLAFDLDDEIADSVTGFERLRHDVRPTENAVDVAQHARLILVEVEHARVPMLQLPPNRDIGHVDGAHGRPAVDELGHLERNLLADGLLGLLGRPAHVGCQDCVGAALQGCAELLRRAGRLLWKDIKRAARKMTGLKSRGGGLDVDDLAAAGVDEIAALVHLGDLGGPDHTLRGGVCRYVQRHKVGLPEQGLQGLLWLGRAQSKLWDDVIEDDLHAERLGQDRQLRADVAVADQTQRLATHLVAAIGRLLPLAAVQLHAAVACLPGQHDDLGHHQLGDAAGVAIRAVEDRDAVIGGR
eukprot:m.240980 g.240980  ORF g.240980 m.240980 type:complete len:346 (+) comp13761_c0_seq1:10-1047(+)